MDESSNIIEIFANSYNNGSSDSIYFNLNYTNSSDQNSSFLNYDTAQKEYIFDREEVRIIFIILYSIVFCCCFFGNLLVILVVLVSRRLKTITNFFLANLAVADFCIGIFCVYQNLSVYLIKSWVFGDFLCKIYHFINCLSYTASIFILVVICMERYLAIQHPISSKHILTSSRLKGVILIVWLGSMIYSLPKFLYVQTITNKVDDEIETICIVNRRDYNIMLFDYINFLLLYVVPLAVMSILYSRIAISLWKSSKGLEKSMPMKNLGGSVSFMETRNRKNNKSERNVLRARRGVVKMLVLVVLAFAFCNFPYHARKMWQYWSDDYQGASNLSALITPLTFLATYFNSGVNPLLYAILSKNFRKGIKEIVCLLNKSKHREMYKRTVTQKNSLITETTYCHVVNMQQT